jgi:hypothetical protein
MASKASRISQHLQRLRAHHPALTISDHGNVDCRSGIPAGYREVIKTERTAQALAEMDGAPARDPYEWVPALIGWTDYSQDYSAKHLGNYKTTIRSGFRPQTTWITKDTPPNQGA